MKARSYMWILRAWLTSGNQDGLLSGTTTLPVRPSHNSLSLGRWETLCFSLCCFTRIYLSELLHTDGSPFPFIDLWWAWVHSSENESQYILSLLNTESNHIEIEYKPLVGEAPPSLWGGLESVIIWPNPFIVFSDPPGLLLGWFILSSFNSKAAEGQCNSLRTK